MFWRFLIAVSVLLLFVAPSASANSDPGSPVINEFVANHTGSDTNEYVEIFGVPDFDYSTLTILEIEGDGSGAGVVDGVFAVGATDAGGFWTTGYMSNVIENGTVTLLLVENFSGSQGDDLDTDNDGALDSTPWSAVIDGIAVDDGGGSDHTYTPVALAAYFDGAAYAPGGASRIPNGTDTDTAADWVRNDFDGAGLPGFTGSPGLDEAYNTPGAVNEAVPPPTDPVINEFVANHTGADDHEYIEIKGDPGADYSRYRILVIEGDGTGAGTVDAIRTPGTTNADGYWVTGFMSGVLENGSQTLLLVEGSTTSLGADLDTDNDGVLDVTSWDRLVDDVALNDGDAGDQVYSSSVLTAGYDGIASYPGGASRIPDGTDTDTADDWMRNDFDGDGLAGFTGTPEVDEALNTPGAMNDTALDTTPPIITVDLDRTVLWPPNHKMVDIMATVTVTDARDPSPTFVLVSISSSEPDNGKGDGNTTDDIQGDDPGTPDIEFMLRSERRGGGEGREYTIVYEATDASGNTSQMTVAVRVPHDQSAMAMSSSGFVADGSGFADGHERFALVIPSRDDYWATDDAGNRTLVSGFDATQIDAHHVYVGNSRGAIRPDQRTVVDADGDGHDDVALYFSIDAIRDLQSGIAVRDINDDSIEIEKYDWKSYGLIGMQFEAPDGAELQVENIFDLGATVSIDRDAGDRPATDGTNPDIQTSIYPNPFNPSMTVTFALTSRERVHVRVFDVAGRLVKTLADGAFASGSHALQWNGHDNHGARVASGIYFVRIDAGSYSVTRRAVMLK